MKEVRTVIFKGSTREELLPDFDPAFPLITTAYPLSSAQGAPGTGIRRWNFSTWTTAPWNTTKMRSHYDLFFSAAEKNKEQFSRTALYFFGRV